MTLMFEKTPVERILSRMYNWKCTSALNYAEEWPDCPPRVREILKELSEKFGNCGWQDGTVFDELRDKNNEVADILGYVWNDDKDFWERK